MIDDPPVPVWEMPFPEHLGWTSTEERAHAERRRLLPQAEPPPTTRWDDLCVCGHQVGEHDDYPEGGPCLVAGCECDALGGAT